MSFLVAYLSVGFVLGLWAVIEACRDDHKNSRPQMPLMGNVMAVWVITMMWPLVIIFVRFFYMKEEEA